MKKIIYDKKTLKLKKVCQPRVKTPKKMGVCLYQLFTFRGWNSGLRSGLGLGHSDTWNMFCFQPFHWSPGFIFRVTVLLEGEPLPQSQVFCSFQQVPSILQSILTIFPAPAEEKHPQNTILPPPCLTVGCVFRVIVFCHIWHLLPYVCCSPKWAWAKLQIRLLMVLV